MLALAVKAIELATSCLAPLYEQMVYTQQQHHKLAPTQDQQRFLALLCADVSCFRCLLCWDCGKQAAGFLQGGAGINMHVCAHTGYMWHVRVVHGGGFYTAVLHRMVFSAVALQACCVVLCGAWLSVVHKQPCHSDTQHACGAAVSTNKHAPCCWPQTLVGSTQHVAAG